MSEANLSGGERLATAGTLTDGPDERPLEERERLALEALTVLAKPKLTLDDVAVLLAATCGRRVSREGLRQIEKRALRKLRRMLSARSRNPRAAWLDGDDEGIAPHGTVRAAEPWL